MSRLLLGAAAVVLLPTTLFAQIPASVASGMGGFGDPRNRPRTPALAAPFVNPLYRPGGLISPFYYNRGVFGGFVGGYAYSPYVDQFYASNPMVVLNARVPSNGLLAVSYTVRYSDGTSRRIPFARTELSVSGLASSVTSA